MLHNVDEKDRRLLQILQRDSSLSSAMLSKESRIPITTVHHRIKKLEEMGIIKGYTVVLDKRKLGMNIAAFILIVVDYKALKEAKSSQHELAKKLMSYHFVEEAALVTGGTDIIIRIRVADINELDTFVTKELRNIAGIEKTQTMIVLHEA